MPRVNKSIEPLNQNQCDNCDKIFKSANGLKLHLDKQICTKNTCRVCKKKVIINAKNRLVDNMCNTCRNKSENDKTKINAKVNTKVNTKNVSANIENKFEEKKEPEIETQDTDTQDTDTDSNISESLNRHKRRGQLKKDNDSDSDSDSDSSDSSSSDSSRSRYGNRRHYGNYGYSRNYMNHESPGPMPESKEDIEAWVMQILQPVFEAMIEQGTMPPNGINSSDITINITPGKPTEIIIDNPTDRCICPRPVGNNDYVARANAALSAGPMRGIHTQTARKTKIESDSESEIEEDFPRFD